MNELDSPAANCDESVASVRFQKLCEYVRSFAATSLPFENWGFLGGRDDLLLIAMEPLEFAAAMEEDCTPEELSELGLHERVNGELRLPSWLDNNIDLYVAIDESAKTIVFSTGNTLLLFPMPRTALDCALERVPPESSQTPVTLFIVESPDAARIMQRLGLQSVSCRGLEELDAHDIQRLFTGDTRNDFGWCYSLILLDFDVVHLENRPTAALGDVINRLADAQEIYNVDPSRRFNVCRPTAGEFQRLERTIAFKDKAQIRQTFENWSTAARSVTGATWRSYLAFETLSFAAARRELSQALQLSRVFRECAVKVALPAYRASGKDAILQKFFDAIDRASDPFDQFDMMAAANYAAIFLDSDPLIRAGEAVLAGKIPASASELCDESFDQQRRCMLELRRLRDRKGKR